MSDSTPRPIRVLLVDDHAVVRKGLRALLDREAESRWLVRLRTARRPFERPNGFGRT